MTRLLKTSSKRVNQSKKIPKKKNFQLYETLYQSMNITV